MNTCNGNWIHRAKRYRLERNIGQNSHSWGKINIHFRKYLQKATLGYHMELEILPKGDNHKSISGRQIWWVGYIKCGSCEKMNIRQTIWKIKTRYKEHIKY
jgi:hypothetical protein